MGGGVVGFLLIPTLAYFALADFVSGASSNVFVSSLVILIALILGWLVSLSFLQQHMGMTRLAVTLLVFTAIFAAPVVKFLRSARTRCHRKTAHDLRKPPFIIWPLDCILGGHTVAGVWLLIALLRALRSFAMGADRKSVAVVSAGLRRARVVAGHDAIPAPKPKPFFLLHDNGRFSCCRAHPAKPGEE